MFDCITSMPNNVRHRGELVTRVFFKEGNPHGVGHCWHCGKAIFRKERVRGEGAWHVDHWPVALRDIHGQVLCGVTDPHDVANLVPSCLTCNTSHRHERTRWHGGSQLRVTVPRAVAVALLLTFACHLTLRAPALPLVA